MKKYGCAVWACLLALCLSGCTTAVDVALQLAPQVAGGTEKSTDEEEKKESAETKETEEKTDAENQETTAAAAENRNRYQKEILDLLASMEEPEPYTSIRPEEVPENPESDFVFETDGGYTWIKEYVGSSAQVKIPANLGGATEAVQIEKDAFKGNETITWLYLPESVHYIDDYSFSSCQALKEVYVAGANEIGMGAFKGCTDLRRVELLSCRIIGGGKDVGAFQDCTSLEEVVFPANLSELKTNAFFGYSRLKKADFSGTELVSVGQQAFTECVSLEQLMFPATLKTLESNACLKCYSLSDVSVDPAGESWLVEDGVLYESKKDGYVAVLGIPASRIKNITLKDGTKSVGGNAFGYNVWVEQVTLPDSCTEIERNGFNTCTALKSVDFGNGLKEVGQFAFQHCESLEEVTLPDSCEVLGDSSFAWIGDSLKKVYLPDHVTYYGDATTDQYVFNCDYQAVFTYQGKEYTYEEAKDWNLK